MDKPYGIMFHHFHNDDLHIKCQGSLDKENFETLILKLKENNVILSAEEWKYKKENDKLKSNEICFTFDDALLCQYEIALPVLKKYNISAFWFLYTSPMEGILEKLEVYHYFRFYKFHDISEFYKAFFEKVCSLQEVLKISPREYMKEDILGNYLCEFSFYTKEDRLFRYMRDCILKEEKYNFVMEQLMEDYQFDRKKIAARLWINREQVKELYESGQVIGLHSHTHPTRISEKSMVEQMVEYKKNKEILEEIIKTKIDVMSHPCNSYNKETLSILKSLEMKLGFRSNIEEGFKDNLECPRMDHVNCEKQL